MGKQRIKPNYRRRVLRLPDLDHCKTAVLNSLGSQASRRVYEYASGHEQRGSRAEGSFEPSPERERCGEKASRRMSCGT
jgi:hypothetical protein